MQDLRDLFRVKAEELVASVTQAQLHEQHALQRTSTPELDKHLDFLKTLPGFTGDFNFLSIQFNNSEG